MPATNIGRRSTRRPSDETDDFVEHEQVVKQIEATRQDAQLYRARGAALELWSCRDEEILIEGPAGTGKTRSILEKFHFCAMKYPSCRILLVRKTRESLTNTVLVTLEEKVIQRGSDILDGPQRNLRSVYRYPNGANIIVGGMDKSTKVMSSEYDLIGTFESTELTEEDFENLTTRLRNGVLPYQQIIADCNPSAPQHWLNKRANNKKMRRLLSRHKDNPVYFSSTGEITHAGEQYLGKLKRLTGHRYLRLFKGKWVAAEGMVYELFDPLVHIIKRFPIPTDWRRIRTIDFGYVNPFVCQWWAISPDGVMYLYREIYKSHVLVDEHAENIKRLSGDEKYEANIADHDAEDRATLHSKGIFTTTAHKDITPGIEAVNLRLKGINNKPRIYIFADCCVELDDLMHGSGLPTCTQYEFDGYSYPKGVDGKPKKEEPVKKDDHGMDTMRYSVAYVDNLAGMNIQVTAENASVVYNHR